MFQIANVRKKRVQTEGIVQKCWGSDV